MSARCLLDVDPDLGEELTPERAELARRHLLVRLERLESGNWVPEADAFGSAGGYGLLVADGLMIRRVRLAHRSAAELLGPGDLLRPWQDDGEHAVYPFASSFRVLQPTTFAILDRHVAIRLAHFPEVLSALMGRAMIRSRRVAGHLVLAQLTSVDTRLIVALWHLAERWGRVRPDGVLLRLDITHETLGFVVGARRPSVTAALGRLAERGLVAPWPEGGWLLGHEPPAEVSALREAEPALQPQPQR